MVCNFKTKGVCATNIKFELDGNVVRGIEFTNGCDGNLKAISKILDGTTVEFIQEKCRGNLCRTKGTSCADQLAIAVQETFDKANKK